MIWIILGVVVFIGIILVVFTSCNNKFLLAVMKIDKAEEDIDMYLMKKKDLLDRTRPIIKKELKLEEFLNDVDFNFDEVNNFDVNSILKEAYNTLLKTIDDNDKLLKSDALNTILDNLEENEENIGGAIRFYNDTVVDFNHLVVSFPSCIIGFFKRYKKKKFYNNEKREMYEILNEK